MNITHISVSRKKTFDQCAQQYKFRYHLKVVSSEEEAVHFTYGKIVHKVAEEYVRSKGARPIGEIASEVLRGKIEIEDGKVAPPLDEEHTKKLTKHLRSIQNLTEKIGCDGIVEHQFRYDLDPPNDRCVVGFIDRIILKGDKAFIIDYKTTKKGKWRVNAETVKTDLQLRCYARVVQREFGIKAENIKCALFYVDGEQLVGASYSDESLLEVEQYLKKAFMEIEASDPDAVWGRVGWHCKSCDFRNMCPFYKPYNEGKSAAWDGDLESLDA